MKKYLFCFIFAFIGITAHSQDIDKFLQRASKTENIDKFKMSGFTMFLGKMIGGVKDIPISKGVKSLEIYSLSDCNPQIKDEFNNLFHNLKDGKGYETLIYTKDENDGIRILIKKKKDVIHDVILLCMDKDDPSIIKFSGKIKVADLNQLINSKNI